MSIEHQVYIYFTGQNTQLAKHTKVFNAWGRHHSISARLGRILFPWATVEMNKYKITNLSKTLVEIAGATAKATVNQKKSLHFLAQVVLEKEFLLNVPS